MAIAVLLASSAAIRLAAGGSVLPGAASGSCTV